MTCYNVYSFEVTETTWSTPLQFGPFVPVLDSLRVLQLKEINLSTNSIFTLKLKAIHADGELPFNGTITFSEYMDCCNCSMFLVTMECIRFHKANIPYPPEFNMETDRQTGTCMHAITMNK